MRTSVVLILPCLLGLVTESEDAMDHMELLELSYTLKYFADIGGILYANISGWKTGQLLKISLQLHHVETMLLQTKK